MVVKMMKWRPWPPIATKKYEVKLTLRRIEGLLFLLDPNHPNHQGERDEKKLTVEIRWKPQKFTLRRRATVKRNFTKQVQVDDVQLLQQNNGIVSWDDEEFQTICTLSYSSSSSDTSTSTSTSTPVFHPWEITFSLLHLNGVNQGQKKQQLPIIATASFNLAHFAAAATNQQHFDLNIPLTLSSAAAASFAPHSLPSLCMSLTLLELKQETTDTLHRSLVPATSPPHPAENVSNEKDEVSAIKAGLRKVKIFTDYVSTRQAKKTCRQEDGSEGRCSTTRSEDGDYNYPFDSDSLDEFEEGETDESKEDASVRKSFSYGTLAYANCAGGSLYSNVRIDAEDEDWFYYSNRKSDVGCSHVDDSILALSEPPIFPSSKRSILPWRKRKLSFRSPKAKGEPLLKKGNDEEGGDDIDFDRRQLSSDESLALRNKTDEDSSANRTSVSEFGDDNFAIGSWEKKEVVSREGHMKLESQVFFASIDQRSERAAGESACTALVAVMADWFQNNRDLMPIKSQFDSLIRDGSLEWRNLCENETYRERFPDKHFDLETVLQAKIRPLSVIPGKSFIGFFHPEGIDEERFEFLHGAMSFDNIWDEISHAVAECPRDGEPQVYVVSWNDHFFLLKVEPEAYYIMDTLGERLYEGCNQAYILKFDSSTVIRKLPNVAPSSDEKAYGDQQIVEHKNQHTNGIEEDSEPSTIVVKPEESAKRCEEEVVCRGKESCKEYIKSFLAAIPIRELQADIKKGLMASAPLHQRLQIEFHYTKSLEATTEPAETMAGVPSMVEVTMTSAAATDA